MKEAGSPLWKMNQRDWHGKVQKGSDSDQSPKRVILLLLCLPVSVRQHLSVSFLNQIRNTPGWEFAWKMQASLFDSIL
jgi:hypothetical protein